MIWVWSLAAVYVIFIFVNIHQRLSRMHQRLEKKAHLVASLEANGDSASEARQSYAELQILYNDAIGLFPTNCVASVFGFKPAALK